MKADKDLYSTNDLTSMALMEHPEDRTFYQKYLVFMYKLKAIVGVLVILGLLVMWYRSEHPSHKDAPVHHARHHDTH